MKNVIFILALLATFTSCGQLKDFLSSPAGQKIEQELIQEAEEVVEEVIKAEI